MNTKNEKELIMRIAPVNYTKQKAQNNNNQPNFGMIFKGTTLEDILDQVYGKGAAFDAFVGTVTDATAKLGKLNHDGQPIFATIQRKWFGRFRVIAECGEARGRSDIFKGALGNTAKDGEEAGKRFVLAAEQAAQNSNPSRYITIGHRRSDLDRYLYRADNITPRQGF